MTYRKYYARILVSTIILEHMEEAAMAKVENNETPDARFKRIAEQRTNAVLDKIRILGNLSNRQMYDYSDEDIEKIFTAINRQLRDIRAKFNSKKPQRFEL